MEILQVGPWILLGVGVVILLGALWGALRQKPAKSLWIMWIIGFAVSGVGIYGPVFLSSYSQFVQTLLQLQKSPSPETYSAALQSVAEGKYPSSYDSIIVNFALSQPVDGMDSILQLSLGKAKDSEHRKFIADAQSAWSGRKAAARELGHRIHENPDGEAKLASLDPVTQSLVARSLLQEPVTEGEPERINRVMLKRLAVFPGQRER